MQAQGPPIASPKGKPGVCPPSPGFQPPGIPVPIGSLSTALGALNLGEKGLRAGGG